MSESQGASDITLPHCPRRTQSDDGYAHGNVVARRRTGSSPKKAVPRRQRTTLLTQSWLYMRARPWVSHVQESDLPFQPGGRDPNRCGRVSTVFQSWTAEKRRESSFL